jgi:hypothetical protein
MRAIRNTKRVVKNVRFDRLMRIEREKGTSLKIEDIYDEVAGVYSKVIIDGNMNAGVAEGSSA